MKNFPGFAGIYSRFPTPPCSNRKPAKPVANNIRDEESTMKTAASHLSTLQLTTVASLAARLPAFVTLMKPRVMALAVFTALVGLIIPQARAAQVLGLVAILPIR